MPETETLSPCANLNKNTRKWNLLMLPFSFSLQFSCEVLSGKKSI